MSAPPSRPALALLALLGAAFPLAGPARGQEPATDFRRLELTPFAGYLWSTHVSTTDGYLATLGAPELGGALDLALDPTSQVELLYVYAKAQTRFVSQYVPFPSSGWFDVRYQYFQVGGTASFPRGDLEPFVAGGIGAVWITPADAALDGGGTADLSDTWLLAFSLGGGLKWFVSRTIGLRFQARLFLPVQLSSGAFYAGSGGAAFTVSGGVPLVQGDLSLGLIVAP